MGEVVQFAKKRANQNVEKALRVLLKKTKAGEIVGLAFVALKKTGPCAGTIDITPEQAIPAIRQLADAVRSQKPVCAPCADN